MQLMASLTVILKIIHRNVGNVVGSYVRDDGLLESFEKLDSSDTFKNHAKSLYCCAYQVDELTIFSNTTSILQYCRGIIIY